MPEGDVVYRTARLLDRTLAGRMLTATDFRVPQHATTDLGGGRVLGTHTRGKHLLTRIDADRPWTLHTHLKMEGVWQRYLAGQRWRRPAHTARVVLTAGDRLAVGFSLGIVELLPRELEHTAVDHLGPDLLAPDWDAAEAVRRLRSDPARSIGAALLDQRNLAGLGTIYASETLFVTGVAPSLPVADVPDLTKLVDIARRLLAFNRDRTAPVTTGVDRRGEQLWTYGRTGQPCRRCGTTVESSEQGPEGQERRLHWCPSCQPLDG